MKMGQGYLRLTTAFLLLSFSCSSPNAAKPRAAPLTSGVAESSRGSLLTLSDVSQLPGAPLPLVQQQVEDASLFENPDPRGPCGAPIKQPSYADAAIVAFVTQDDRDATLVQAIWDNPSEEARDLIRQTRSDIRPVCPPFTSETPFGQQEVEFVEEIRLEIPASDAVATSARIALPKAPLIHAANVLVRRGDRLTAISVFGEDSLPATFIAALADAAARKL